VLMVIFALWLGWLPASGMYAAYGGGDLRDLLAHLVLPAVTLAAASVTIIARLTRATMLETLGQDYIRTARAKGVVERAVVLRHGLKNALIPIVTVVGVQAGYLLGGAVLTETVFAWPGVGTLMVQGILARDFPLVQGGVLVVAPSFVLVHPAAAPARPGRRGHGRAAASAPDARPCARHRRVRARPAGAPGVGRARVAAGRRGDGGGGDADRRDARNLRRLLHGLDRERRDAADRHPDGVSLHPARHRHRGRARPRPPQRDDRHRGRRLPDLRAPGARRGPLAAGARVRGGRPSARQRRCPYPRPPHPAPPAVARDRGVQPRRGREDSGDGRA